MTDRLARAMTEDELLQAVTDALTLYGWLVHHDRRSDKALQMGMPGFPDVCAVHPKDGRLLFLELKSETGQLTTEQNAWCLAISKLASLADRRVLEVLRPSALDRFIRDPYITGAGR